MKMEFIDTHTHLYLPEFDGDREAVIQRAREAGVSKMFLPNIDRESVQPMMELVGQFPDACYPMMGLHPGSVDAAHEQNLKKIREQLDQIPVYAIGEIGIDLYWDQTYREEQMHVFSIQLRWALDRDLPVVIHIRNSFPEVFEVLESVWATGGKGIFHCFSGNLAQARRAIDMGFLLGIGGVLTFRNSGLQQVVKQVGLEHLVLETDAPYLAPVPYRGKRNESSYLPLVAEALAGIREVPVEEVSRHTTRNANTLFFNHS